MSEGPRIKLNSGFSIPQVGLGSWNSKPGEVKAAVKIAVQVGYRHIDCALAYQNEKEIGEALKELFAEGTVKRDDLFITSKLWSTFHRKEKVKECLQLSLNDLGLSYLDLYLMHGPMGFKEGDSLFPLNPDGTVIPSDVDYLEAWNGMEQLLETGLVRSIGVCNFSVRQLQRLLEHCHVKPAMNQYEMHPFLPNKELLQFCHSHDIAVTAFCSLGSPNVPDAVTKKKLNLLEDPRVKKIADKHGKGTNHVLLRFAIDQGVCVIPKSVTENRIKDNFNLFDFTLDKEDLEELNNFEESFRIVTLARYGNHKFHPLTGEL